MSAGGDERRLVFRLLTYWRGLTGDRRQPSNADIIAEDLGEDLACCAVLKREAVTGRFFVVSIGEALDPPDYPMKGRFIQDCPGFTLLSQVLRHQQPVVNKRVPVSFGGELIVDDRLMKYRCILLPLSDDDTTIDGLLIGANYRMEPLETPAGHSREKERLI